MIILLVFGISAYLGVGLLMGRMAAITITRRKWFESYIRDEAIQFWSHFALFCWPVILVGAVVWGVLYGTWSITQRIMIPGKS